MWNMVKSPAGQKGDFAQHHGGTVALIFDFID